MNENLSDVLIFDLSNQKKVSKFWLNTFQYQLDRKIYPNECDVMLRHSITLYDTKFFSNEKYSRLLRKLVENADINCIDFPDIYGFETTRNEGQIDNDTCDLTIKFEEKPSELCINTISDCEFFQCPTLMENQELILLYDFMNDMIEDIDIEGMINEIDKEVDEFI